MNIFLYQIIQDSRFMIPAIDWIISFVIIVVVGFFIAYLQHYYQRFNRSQYTKFILKFIIQVVTKPFLCLLTFYLLFITTLTFLHYSPLFDYELAQHKILTITNIVECVCFFWLIFSLVKYTKFYLILWANEFNHATFSIILPAISSSLYALVFFIMMNILIPQLNLPNNASQYILNNLARAALIGMIGWLFVQIVNTAEQFIIKQYVLNNNDLYKVRKINTQLTLLKRIIIAVVVAITTASILMLFDSIHNLGVGILTTAGIISAIGAFASQQSISRLFAGLLIAFTQPIRIGDTIIVDNELGQVEEISLSYIVVKLWDLRRLILPTDYLMNKGLQNLTRESSDLLGTTFFYMDFTLPVETVRNKFFELLNASAYWDKKVASFHVTDVKEGCIEIRGLMSAENSSKLWELRCQIREQLIRYIVEHYPQCLSRSRKNLN